MLRGDIVKTLKERAASGIDESRPGDVAVKFQFHSIAQALVGEDFYADAVKAMNDDEIIRRKQVMPIMRRLAQALTYIVQRELQVKGYLHMSVHVCGLTTKYGQRDFLIELGNQESWSGHCTLLETTERGKVVECDLDAEGARASEEERPIAAGVS